MAVCMFDPIENLPGTVSDLESEREDADNHQLIIPAQEPAPGLKTGEEAEAPVLKSSSELPINQRRKRSDSITSISEDEFLTEDQEYDKKNFGARAPMHPSEMRNLLPPMFSENLGLEAWDYDALVNADKRGDLDTRLKIIRMLERSEFGSWK